MAYTVQIPPATDGELDALEREFDAVAAADADATAGLAAKAQADWRRGVAVRVYVRLSHPELIAVFISSS